MDGNIQIGFGQGIAIHTRLSIPVVVWLWREAQWTQKLCMLHVNMF
jgi:hypothetical protein